MTTPIDQALAHFTLGESEDFIRLEGIEDFCKAERLLISQAKREVFILTPDLEPERFNEPEFASALSAFVRRSRFTDLRILVADPAIAIRWGHHVVTLGRRLTSNLKIRQLTGDDARRPEAWMVVDDIGMLRRDGHEGFSGVMNPKAIPHAQKARRDFIDMWERSSEIKDFRQLHL
jgi:hypothetical protein